MLMAGDSNHFRRFSVGVAMLTATAALLAGCSGDSADSDDSSSSDSSSSKDSDSAKNSRSGDLKVGDPGVVSYESGDEKTELEVTPMSITPGAIADLSQFNLKDDQKNSTPFYVTTRYKNMGSTVLKYPSFDVKMNAVDATGQRYSRAILFGTFDKCKSENGPETFGQDATLTTCGVYLIPNGATLVKLQYEGNFDDEPTTWEK